MSIERQLAFIVIFTSVLALVNYYVYKRFFSRLGPRLRIAGMLLMAIVMIGEIIFAVDMVGAFIPESLSLYMILSAFIGTTFMLFVVALVYDLAISVSRRVPFDQERRRAIKVMFDITMLVSAASYLWHGFVQGTRLPEIHDVILGENLKHMKDTIQHRRHMTRIQEEPVPVDP